MKPYPGAPVSVPPSSGMNETANVTESQPRRITPIPISRAQNQPSTAAAIKSTEEILQSASEVIQRHEAEKLQMRR